ncbi:MAG: LpxI family protein [Candidatus Poribacteria bacterium]
MGNTQKLGIIAGSGDLPELLAFGAKLYDRQPIIICVTNNYSSNLPQVASEFHQFHVGQLKKIVKTLRDEEIQELALIGKVNKDVLLKPLWLDSLARKILTKARNGRESGSSILKALVEELESIGFVVIDQRRFLSNLLFQAGVFTKRKPSKGEWQDIYYGIDLARKVAGLDIGQTVVVKNQMPLAIEAMEGTDEAIRRGGRLGGAGVVVAKAVNVDHDFRFDVPTVGPRTLEVMKESSATVLAIDAERTFLLDAENVIKGANEHNISIVAVSNNRDSPKFQGKSVQCTVK